ncbi:LLM class flavin-dependent oxidoreductase [Pseudonocardia pini]|uniref:LLM class flavin-dependent oxidoreductase n=1 Tax=Pseudonocardia pini TaxID=2758030 RepID=UPI001C68FAED|nr:LLM class flavin-dependent oxidoreductase [Pseudonocardia pini]
MRRLRFGVQIFPYHNPTHNPTLQFEEDLQLVEHLDRLGFDEAWCGEHHSTGWESIASPELFAMAAAGRTKHIRLGLGVTSVPYHHPLMLADRVLQLDHLTRGRVIWGMGTGSVAQDASMMGLDTQELRRMSEEGVEAIMALLAYDEPVTRKTDWFTLQDAALQLRPYSDDIEIRVAAMVSPSGPRLAGRHGLGLFQFGVPGEDALAGTWRIMEETAAEHGKEVSRDRWSVLQHVYLADTEEQARADVRWNLDNVIESLARTTPLFPEKPRDHDHMVDMLNDGPMLIGTPEMAIARIEDILTRSGGVGSFIIGHLEAAEPERMRRSYEMFARHVMPHFNGQRTQRLRAVQHSIDFGQNADRLAAAQQKAVKEYEAARGNA